MRTRLIAVEILMVINYQLSDLARRVRRTPERQLIILLIHGHRRSVPI